MLYDEELLDEIINEINEINMKQNHTIGSDIAIIAYIQNFQIQKKREFGMITLDMLKIEPYKTQYINELKNHIINHNKINEDKKKYIIEHYIPPLLTDEWWGD